MTAATCNETGNPRTGQRVWRNSYYRGQVEDRLWRPFMDRGGMRGAKRRIGVILKSARHLELRTRKERQKKHPGTRNGILGQVGLDVLEALYNQFLEYRSGKLDPAIETIAHAVGHSYAAVHRALRRLRSAGFLHWIRRSEPIEGAEGCAGPQVRQITNAYALLLPPGLEALVARFLGKMTQKGPTPDDISWTREQQRAEWEEMLSGLSATHFLEAMWTGDQLAGESLARIARMLDERESSKAGVTRDV